MKPLLLVTILLLSGCSLFKVIPDFPEAPQELLQTCDPLIVITEDEPKRSDVTKIVTKNYQTYHNCKIVVDGWNTWYTEQKKLYESKK